MNALTIINIISDIILIIANLTVIVMVIRSKK